MKPRHTKPPTPPNAILLAEELLAMGVPAAVALLLLQPVIGFRPSEGLKLVREHLVPAWAIRRGCVFAQVLLGPQHGTKSGRPQVVRVESQLGVWLLRLLYRL